jgi:hypothetical protein
MSAPDQNTTGGPGDGPQGSGPGGGGEWLGNEILKRVVVTRFDVEQIVLVPILAVIIALVLGGIVMLATGVSMGAIGTAFVALFTGSVGSVSALSETLTAAAPLTLAGLGLALGFRAGLFNIGAEGQLILGGMAAVAVGFMVHAPAYIHLPLALLAGALVGALWAAIAGWLRRRPARMKSSRRSCSISLPCGSATISCAIRRSRRRDAPTRSRNRCSPRRSCQSC